MRRTGWVASTIATLAVPGGRGRPGRGGRRATPSGSGCRRCPSSSPASRPPHSPAPAGRNPFIALLPRPGASDYAYWRAAMQQKARSGRAKPRALAVEPLLVDEQEPDALRGGNDTPATAQLIPAFGSAAGRAPGGADPRHARAGRRRRRVRRGPGGQRLDPARRRHRPDRPRRVDHDRASIGDGPHGSRRRRHRATSTSTRSAARAPGSGSRVDIDTPTRQPRLRSSSCATRRAPRRGVNDDDGQASTAC